METDDMCSQDILDKLNNTVEQFISQGRLFTGYDVTLETREREKIKLRHSEVRGDIHDLPSLKDEFEFGDYERHRVDMPGGGWAWVYCKRGDDPNQYTPQNQSKSVPISITNSPSDAVAISVTNAPVSDAVVDDSVISDSGGKQGDGAFATDYRDRLMVPKSFLQVADLNPGDDCYIHHDVDSNKLVISNCDQTSANFHYWLLGTYRVERNGDIRLSAKNLRKLKGNDKFKIKSESNSVIVEVV